MRRLLAKSRLLEDSGSYPEQLDGIMPLNASGRPEPSESRALGSSIIRLTETYHRLLIMLKRSDWNVGRNAIFECIERKDSLFDPSGAGQMTKKAVRPLHLYFALEAPRRISLFNTVRALDHGDPPPLSWSTLRYVLEHEKRATMPRKRPALEAAVTKLRQVDVLVSQGKSVADAVCSIGTTGVTYCRWRKELGRLKTDQVKRMTRGPVMVSFFCKDVEIRIS